VLASSKAIVANSQALKMLSEQYDPFEVGVIPNGVDTSFFSPQQGKRDGAKVVRLLFVGRFTEQKNLFFLLEQMEKVAGEISTPFELCLVGSGPQEEQLKAYARNLDIRKRITWHGWMTRREVRDHYRRADCLLIPSLYEGMPNVILEAMACSLPVVASNIPGNKEVVRPNETGLLFELTSGEHFRRSVIQILTVKGLAAKLGQNGRQRVERDYSWHRVAVKYMQLLAGDGNGV
jgi:glycosyltransferase involved in cell wall biosynthesis